MREENDFFFSEDETMEIVQRFESMLKHNQNYFFDVVDFENIIDFYLSSDNSKLASEAVDIAYSMHPHSTEIQLRKAELLVINNKFSDALSILAMLERIEPENGEIFFLKGQAYLAQKELKQANEAFWHVTNCYTDDKVDMLYRIASLYQEADEVNYAIRFLLIAFSIDSSSLNILFELGYCYERLGDLDKSDKYYNLYLDINPFSTSVWYNLGIIHTRSGNFAKALEAYDFALVVDPSNVSAIHNMANTYATIEKYAEASELFMSLLDFEPENPRVYSSIGECFEKLGKNDKAIEYFDMALGISSSLSDAYYGKALVYLKSQRVNLALESIKKSIALEPENYDYWLGLAKVKFEMGEDDEAIEAYREATLLNADEPDAYIGLAEIRLFQERFDIVEEIYHEVGEKFNDVPALKIIYAAALYLIGKPKLALNMLKQAKKHNPFTIEDFHAIVSVVNDDDFLLKLKQL